MHNAVSSATLQRLLTAALVLCSLTTGCDMQLPKSLLELTRLQAALAREYKEPNVNVTVNNDSSLVVTFINSALNNDSYEERQKRATQTAAFVSQQYPRVAELADIWVGFVKIETRFVFMHYSRSLNFFRFDRLAHPLAWDERSEHASGNRARASAIYSDKLDRTEISVALMQLEGDTNNGLALSPHFSVPGNASGVRRALATPQSVNFDFSSFSEKSMFPGAPKIIFLADGKTVFETEAQFSTSKSRDGQFSEFLLLPVPYPAFRRLAAAAKVRIRIGDGEYELTEEQVGALREMAEHVKA
jgi:ribonuclease HI